jgi:hypothetical protein
MLKLEKIGLFFIGLAFLTSSAHACLKIDDFASPEFCQVFSEIARCHCNHSGLPSRLCQNVQDIYRRMIATFGSIEKACRFQKDTSQENCMNAWKCYLQGGQLENGQSCSSCLV